MEIKITDNSPKVKEELEAAVLKALTTCGLTAEGYAKQLCPVDTGNLRNSITYTCVTRKGKTLKLTKEMQKAGQKPVETVVESSEPDTVYIGSAIFYAVPVEMGTSKKSAQPFLKPAVADHAEKYREIIKNALKG